MKSTLALTLFATVAFHQVVLAQQGEQDQEVNIATALPTLPTLNTDIYWWKTLLTGDEINNYLTGPATEAATAAATATTQNDASAATTATTEATEATGAATTASAADASAASAATEAVGSLATSLASVESSLASAVSEVSASASDVLSSVSNAITSSSGAVYSSPSVAWSSSYAAPSVAGASSNGILPRPSGSIIPPVTTSGSALPSNSGALIIADLGKILFSVTVAAVLGNLI